MRVKGVAKFERFFRVAADLNVDLALDCSFKIIDLELKNPDTKHWQRALRLFDLRI